MKQVLIVDDSDLALSVLEAMLRTYFTQTEIIRAKNGKEALEKFQLISPDLIISDIDMPIMGGVELFREVRKISPVPVLLISGGYGEEKRKEAEGVDAFMSKPVRPSALYAVITAIVPM